MSAALVTVALFLNVVFVGLFRGPEDPTEIERVRQRLKGKQ